MENVEYTIVSQEADVITSSGDKRKYTIISREKSKYSAVTIVHGAIWSEFEVYKTDYYNTYIEKLEKDQKPCIQWGDDFIYPQDSSEWWQPNYTLKVFTEYDWGGGYWKTYTLQQYLELRASYGTRSDIKEFAKFLDKLANVMEYFK